jgi:hypothetical protein
VAVGGETSPLHASNEDGSNEALPFAGRSAITATFHRPAEGLPWRWRLLTQSAIFNQCAQEQSAQSSLTLCRHPPAGGV